MADLAALIARVPPKLTKAQWRTLQALSDAHPDAYCSLEVIERGYTQIPIFRARLKSVPCPTCGHPSKEAPLDWDCVEALDKAGLVSERVRGSSAYFITDAGLKALQARAGQ